MYRYMYIYTYIHTYIHTHIHTYIYIYISNIIEQGSRPMDPPSLWKHACFDWLVWFMMLVECSCWPAQARLFVERGMYFHNRWNMSLDQKIYRRGVGLRMV